MNSGEDLYELESIEQRVSSHAIDWGDKQRAYYDGYDGKKQMHRRTKLRATTNIFSNIKKSVPT